MDPIPFFTLSPPTHVIFSIFLKDQHDNSYAFPAYIFKAIAFFKAITFKAITLMQGYGIALIALLFCVTKLPALESLCESSVFFFSAFPLPFLYPG